MKRTGMPWPQRLLTASGLLMISLPLLFSRYVTIPDFYRGLIMGLGLALMILSLILQRKTNKVCFKEGRDLRSTK
ncbi:MAG: hypothetical protein P4L41_17530 [Flavipsychrobacter sp.]|nr:hypothetical protein [Flavipsychrobacter sp.]